MADGSQLGNAFFADFGPSAPPSGGTITGVTAGVGLSGGGTAGQVNIDLETPVTIANGGTGGSTATGTGPVVLANSPVLGGNPTGPTPATADNSQSFATTAFVKNVVAGLPAGTITNVSAGHGLTGGGASGAVTLALATPVAVADGGTGATSVTGTGANVLGTSPTLTTPTINTSLTVSNAGGAATLTIDAPAGNLRTLAYTSGGSARWFINCTAAAESGSNAGSDFNIQRRDDTGANLGTAFTIARATGQTNILNGLAINGVTAHGVLIGQSGGNAITSTAAGTLGQTLTSQGASADPTFTTAAGGQVSGNPNPPTAPLTAAMMGMGAATNPCVFTPARNGRVLLIFSGQISCPVSATVGSGIILNLFYGTGAAPAAGAAPTGTLVGQALRAVIGYVPTGFDIRPFTFSAFVTGLAVGTQYWADLQQALAVSGGTANAQNVQFTFLEQ